MYGGREWREDKTSSSIGWIFIPVAACQRNGPGVHSKGDGGENNCCGTVNIPPCHRSLAAPLLPQLRLSAEALCAEARMLMFCRRPYVCVHFAAWLNIHDLKAGGQLRRRVTFFLNNRKGGQPVVSVQRMQLSGVDE